MLWKVLKGKTPPALFSANCCEYLILLDITNTPFSFCKTHVVSTLYSLIGEGDTVLICVERARAIWLAMMILLVLYFFTRLGLPLLITVRNPSFSIFGSF